MKTVKKILLLCLIFAIVLNCSAFATNEDRVITVWVNGKQIEFDVNPVLENGRTLVPMRFIFEALGAEVSWIDASQTAIAQKDDTRIEITVNESILLKNGMPVALDVPAKLVNGRTLVPVRAVSEGLGASVEWIWETNQVIITTYESDDYLTYWSVMDGASSQSLSNYSQMLMYQEMEKATGVKVEFLHPYYGATGTEAFNVLLASMDLPDMIEFSWNNYAGGADAAIDDSVIIALNDYLEEYAPNYYSYVAGKKNEESGNRYKAEAMTDSGNYYGFRALNIGDFRGFSGLVVRNDLLQKWGLDIPSTIDDWESVFAKAKAEGYTKPFTCHSNPFALNSVNHTFNTAYDVGKGYYIEEGKVVYGLLQPGYKEFVAQIADWVQKGYIDLDFPNNTLTDADGNMTQENVSVACFGWLGSTMGKILPAMEERNPEYNLVACPYPVLNKGDACEWQEVQPEVSNPEIAITTECRDIASAMKWCDYLYSDEGAMLKMFGIEDYTYTIEKIDGENHFIYTDVILKPETTGANSVNAALYKLLRPAHAPGINNHPDYLNGYYPYLSQKDALVTWNANLDAAKKHALPQLTFTSDELAEIATLTQQYHSRTEADVSAIMLGYKSIDEFDRIASEAEANYLGRILQIENDAYQRYLDRLNK